MASEIRLTLEEIAELLLFEDFNMGDKGYAECLVCGHDHYCETKEEIIDKLKKRYAATR